MRKVTIFEYEKNERGNIKQPSNLILAGKGLFHCWGSDFEEFETAPGNYTVGIVELMDGQIVKVCPALLRFDEPPTSKSEGKS